MTNELKKSTFRRKHYLTVARAIQNTLVLYSYDDPAVELLTDLITEFNRIFKEDNPAFDVDKFLKASGLGPMD